MGLGARASGRVVLRLSDAERELLLYWLGELEPVVEPDPPRTADPLEELVGISNAERPADPAELRLFPDAYTEPEQALEFRRFTENGLRREKHASLALVRDTLHGSGAKLVLSRPQAEAWLASLNDLRLWLGTRIGVTADPARWDELDEDDPLAFAAFSYEYFGWLQATLLAELYGIDT